MRALMLALMKVQEVAEEPHDGADDGDVGRPSRFRFLH
jgi:hypothetical protein